MTLKQDVSVKAKSRVVDLCINILMLFSLTGE